MTGERAPSPVVTIDDPENGGSDPGAWATHIAHTPSLAAQLGDFLETQQQDPNVND